MIPWRDIFFTFSRLPEAAELLLAPQPAWIWSRDGGRLLWANPAGGEVLGARSFGILAARERGAGDPLRRQLRALGGTLPEAGALARLALHADARAMPVPCRCHRVRIDGVRGILAFAVEPSSRAADLPAVAAFLSEPDVVAVIQDEDGATLAGGEAGGFAPDEPHIELLHAGRKLRLYLGGRNPGADEPAKNAAESDSPPIDNASLLIPARDAAEAPAETQAAARVREAVQTPAERNPESSARRSVTAGRVERELSRSPVRFLWQTDAADRFLFLSPGLAQVVGRNADIVGERWRDVAARLRLDPGQRISRALAQRDTWSGQTAWWPVEGSNVRVPAELTALPIFGGDHSFQGYRGFGVLRPAEALMPATFDSRFAPAGAGGPSPAEQVPPYEESPAPGNVVPIRADLDRIADNMRLTPQERNAFEEIAAALRERVEASGSPAGGTSDAGSASGGEGPDDAPPGQPTEHASAAEADPPQAAERHEPPAGYGVPTLETAEEAAPPMQPAGGALTADVASDHAPADAEVSSAEPPAVATPEQARLPETRPVADRAAPSDGEAQRRLREMTAILDTATDGVVTLDGDGVIESVNASAEALFGLDAHEMQGLRFSEFLTPATREAADDYLSGLKDNGVASLLNEGREIEARAGAGSIPLFMTMGRISGGSRGRFCAVLRDITHWKRTEAELLEARRAAEAASSQKSEFLARVSHEIRTPLNAIIGFAEVMIEERFGAVENERYREYLRDIRTSGEHLVSLVNDLLDISKIEAGKLDLHFVAVPLNELVRECIAMMQPQASRARVVVRSSLSRDVPGIVADHRTCRQIILNLLSNSVKFTGPGGQVIASTSLAETGEALLRIRDTGEGMSEEELQRALEPFRQISTAALADRTGTGLGLPLTKALVEANRAALSIRSARGEGTVVTITFPPTRVLSE